MDVDGPAGTCTVPRSNPYAGGDGRGELWATGVRNPWRFAFDEGRLYVADVGQYRWPGHGCA